MITFVSVIIGACCGALSRWGITVLLNFYNTEVPPGTLLCNILGAYLMGIIIGLTKNGGLSEAVRIGITVGFLGSFTTFSTYTAEAMNLLYTKKYYWLLLYFLLHNLGSLTMMFLGLSTTSNSVK